LYLWLAQPTWGSLAAGAAVAALGLGLRAFAAGHLRKSAEITTSGPYAYTRNPLYLGSLVMAAGFAVASRNPWVALLIAVYFALIYYPVIRWEEEYLRNNFPEFAAYSASVPRLVPKWRSAPSSGTFSPELYMKYREYNALLGSAAMMLALVIKLMWVAR
jgi:protein-S-isoprenylcysteine O-methyltransferase Ste14